MDSLVRLGGDHHKTPTAFQILKFHGSEIFQVKGDAALLLKSVIPRR